MLLCMRTDRRLGVAQANILPPEMQPSSCPLKCSHHPAPSKVHPLLFCIHAACRSDAMQAIIVPLKIQFLLCAPSNAPLLFCVRAAWSGRIRLLCPLNAPMLFCVCAACRSDLMQAIVPRMAASDTEIRDTACAAIRALLASPDTTGKVALEALQLVADLIRKRK